MRTKQSDKSVANIFSLEFFRMKVFMHNKAGVEGGLSLDTLSSYCDANPVAFSWLAFYDDCEGQVWLIGSTLSWLG